MSEGRSTFDDDELEELLIEMDRVIARQRIYASFRELGPKELKEADVVRDLLEALSGSGGPTYSNVTVAASDPPDCIAWAQSGGAVAIEVTEFVSEHAVRLNEATRRQLDRRPDITEMVMAQWSRDAFVSHLDDVLQDKDGKILNGGPFEEYVVVIHTDEPLLVSTTVEEWLASETFGPLRQITSAYLLFSYHPGVGYPIVQVQISDLRSGNHDHATDRGDGPSRTS